MKTNVWLITALTNLHAGDENKANYGIIDNPIQRDVLTNLPCINSSSLKGAINEFCCHAGMSETARLAIFGSDKNNRENSRKGNSMFFDAKLLLLPVQDDSAALYHYETSAEVLNMANERINMFDIALKLPVDGCELKRLLRTDKEIRLVNDISSKCDEENLPIIARNKLENGLSANLWYEQILPSKSVLYFFTNGSEEDTETLLDWLDNKLVQIGANATIDRAALSATLVGDGTCIDNLVMVGHNVHIGRDCLIVSQVGISGSTHVGDNVTMAGQAGISGHLHIGNNSTIGPQAGVAKDISEGQVVGGSPTMDYNTYLRNATLMPKLPELFKRVARLEKEMGHKPMASDKTDRSLVAMWNRWMSMMHHR